MICPHCSRTILEQDYYTMSVRPRAAGEPLVPRWAWPAVWLLVFLATITTLVVFHI